MNDSLDSLVSLDESVNVAGYFPRLFPLDWGNAGQYELRLVKPSEAHDTKAALGIPYNARAVTVTLQAPFGQKEYTYEVFATYDNLPDAKDSLHAGIVFMPGEWRHTLPISIVIWRRRVYCQGIAGYIEARGDPRTERTPTKLPELPDCTMQDAKRVLKGFSLLRKIERRGRPSGRKSMSEAEFRQRYPEVYQQLLDAYESKPHRYEVADAMGMDRKTFRQNLKDYKLPFPPF